MLLKKEKKILDEITQVVCEYFGIDKNEINLRYKHPTLTYARQCIIFVARKYYGISTYQISKYMDRSRTALRHSYKAAIDRGCPEEIVDKLLDKLLED